MLTVGDLSVDDAFNRHARRTWPRAKGSAWWPHWSILVVVFGALVAAGVPVVLAVVSIIVAIGLTALLGRVMDLSFFIVNMITMIGLAVGIDYALFIVERYREERRRGRPQAGGDRDRRGHREQGGASSRAPRWSSRCSGCS